MKTIPQILEEFDKEFKYDYGYFLEYRYLDTEGSQFSDEELAKDIKDFITKALTQILDELPSRVNEEIKKRNRQARLKALGSEEKVKEYFKIKQQESWKRKKIKGDI